MSATKLPAATCPLPGAACVALTDQVIVRVAGTGTDRFLQGQFSQEVANATEQFAPRAAACTPKGRAYCLTRMVRDGDDVLMALPESLAGETIAHLRKYLMLFRGTSMAVDTDAAIVGLLGESGATAMSGDPAARLPEPGDSVAISGGHLIRTMDTSEGLVRFEFWQTGELSPDIAEALNAVRQETLATWQASEIAAGVPSLGPETRESYIPQMLNWQALGGVHFKKGCYTGQEVIARMHFLGQLKKSLFRFSCPAAAGPLAAGMPLTLKGRTVGDIVNSVRLSDGTYQCLAVVRHDAADAELVTEHAPDIPLTRFPLPYKVAEQEQRVGTDT